MRGYSVLSAGERLVISCEGQAYGVTVVEVRPGACVSIMGCLDLEVDLVPPSDGGTGNLKHSKAAQQAAAAQRTHHFE
jgi:hypothetical protein